MTDSGRRLPLASTHDADDDTVDSSPATAITRRSALQGLAVGLGLSLAHSAEASDDDHPLAHHVAQRPARSAPKVTRAPQFFDAHQFATLTIVSELIVPGSVASGSPAFIDDVLAVEHDDVRRAFVSALAAVDVAARTAHGATFRALPASQQPAVLESLTAPLSTLKSWIAGAHYSSEAGMKELGFTGNVFFQSFPACTHADGHQ